MTKDAERTLLRAEQLGVQKALDLVRDLLASVAAGQTPGPVREGQIEVLRMLDSKLCKIVKIYDDACAPGRGEA